MASKRFKSWFSPLICLWLRASHFISLYLIYSSADDIVPGCVKMGVIHATSPEIQA